jgi:hypothetical protein
MRVNKMAWPESVAVQQYIDSVVKRGYGFGTPQEDLVKLQVEVIQRNGLSEAFKEVLESALSSWTTRRLKG